MNDFLNQFRAELTAAGFIERMPNLYENGSELINEKVEFSDEKIKYVKVNIPTGKAYCVTVPFPELNEYCAAHNDLLPEIRNLLVE